MLALCGSSPRTWGTPMEYKFTVKDMTAHPHARGEHCNLISKRYATCGSSPRTWGTLCLYPTFAMCDRLIPTHVGNTPTCGHDFAAASAHPHARGEHWPHQNSSARPFGSSPRTWGTRRIALCVMGIDRLIPTHVGNTSAPYFFASQLSAHPHARGEHTQQFTEPGADSGSSPRTWGTRVWKRQGERQARLIPTHVGNTR